MSIHCFRMVQAYIYVLNRLQYFEPNFSLRALNFVIIFVLMNHLTDGLAHILTPWPLKIKVHLVKDSLTLHVLMTL